MRAIRARVCAASIILLAGVTRLSGCGGDNGSLGYPGATGPAGPTRPAGPAGSTGPAGAQGSQGAQGQAGANGSLRIYGDGSAGARTISAFTYWTNASPPITDPAQFMNLQFTDFTINAGQTLIVPTGTVIRCTGAFTNNGTIAVYVRPDSRGLIAPGITLLGAGNGQQGSLAATVGGGLGGGADLLSEGTARSLLHPGIPGGGHGAFSGMGIGVGSREGGGALTVLAQGPIQNALGATIGASGGLAGVGAGGGAGGIIILGSRTSVTNAGTISANGGAGGPSQSDNAPGGGGGGGIVHLLAPVITAGTITVTPGSAGSSAIPVTTSPRGGGGGGGGCGGMGGRGGFVQTSNSLFPPAEPGTNGFSLQTLVDPTSLF